MNPNIDHANLDTTTIVQDATMPTITSPEPQFTAQQMVDEQMSLFRAQILTLIDALNPYIDDGYPTFTHGAQLVKANHLLGEALGIIFREPE